MVARDLSLYPCRNWNRRREGVAVAVSYPGRLELCYLHSARLPENIDGPSSATWPVGEELPRTRFDVIVLGDLMPWTYARLHEVLAHGGSPIIIRPHLDLEEHILLSSKFENDAGYCAWLAEPTRVPGMHIIVYFRNALRIRGRRVRLADDDLGLVSGHGTFHADDQRRFRMRGVSLNFVYDVTKDTSPSLWLHATTVDDADERPDFYRDSLLLGSRRVCADNIWLARRRLPARVLTELPGVLGVLMGSDAIYVPLRHTHYYCNPTVYTPKELAGEKNAENFSGYGKCPPDVTSLWIMETRPPDFQ